MYGFWEAELRQVLTRSYIRSLHVLRSYSSRHMQQPADITSPGSVRSTCVNISTTEPYQLSRRVGRVVSTSKPGLYYSLQKVHTSSLSKRIPKLFLLLCNTRTEATTMFSSLKSTDILFTRLIHSILKVTLLMSIPRPYGAL